ncbi:2-oxo acid dehydrogenase subunit E2 [Nocardia otitidiscaviarum]|uniref:2-oxo acid dehydrogenase subunit E2 n=1 Tax=Nocardia otitidiscaviarum TaxID=1823 RepID=UPI001894D8EF|nr:2-oxo acid dehydrogenase subunit E2 [Nocardia otitidiscaviarum]MBF6182268.1 2-oxo acid dehydrogenase subunit E2 [Nocardia otitidiscaviarum]
MPEFRMPSLGADMTEGTLLHWMVHPGETVHAGDVIAEVDTTKAAIEIECFDDGVIGTILVPEGETVPVGAVLATIEPAAGSTPPPPDAAGAVNSPPSAVNPPASTGEPEPRRGAPAAAETGLPSRARGAVTSAPGSRPPADDTGNGMVLHEIRVTPLVRRLAAEAGIDLATVTGSGPDGRIVRADIERVAAERTGTSPAAGLDNAVDRARDAGASTQAETGQSYPTPSATSRPKHVAGRGESDLIRRDAGPVAPSEPGVDVVAAERGSGQAEIAETGRAAYRLHVRASGYARRVARELAVDLAEVTGTGPGGALRAADIRAAHRESIRHVGTPGDAAEFAGIPGGSVGITSTSGGAGVGVPGVGVDDAAVEPGAAGHTRDVGAVRAMIAAAMTRSKQTVPHYYLSSTIDMAAAVGWLRETNRRLAVSERVLPAALLLRATALAARKVPDVNGFWVDGRFEPAERVDLGVVVSLRGGGIIVPTVPRADTLSVPATMAAVRGIVARSRDGQLRAADATPATLTVTNLGDLGVDSVFGVIPPPQVAIVGFGAVTERPCAVDGLLGVRPQVTATLSADHRASDGAVGARFLHTLSERLQHPEEL